MITVVTTAVTLPLPRAFAGSFHDTVRLPLPPADRVLLATALPPRENANVTTAAPAPTDAGTRTLARAVRDFTFRPVMTRAAARALGVQRDAPRLSVLRDEQRSA